MTCIYLLAGDEYSRALALAEAQALAHASPCGPRLVRGETSVAPERTGYLAAGLELIADAPSLDLLCRRIVASRFAADRFAIEVRNVPAGLPVSRRETAAALGLVINGRPDLDNPANRFLVFATPDHLWFGAQLGGTQPDWRRFRKKPEDYSSALPAQAARAVCNLVLKGGERIVDPCCGSGTLLLHAAALGASVAGFDLNWKMVAAARINLAHFGLPGSVAGADAALLSGHYDALITNLPYGNMSPVADAKLAAIVSNVLRLAPRGLLISSRDLSAMIHSAGARLVQTIPLPKFSFTRLIFLYDRPA